MEAGIAHYLNKKYVKSVMPEMKNTDFSVDPVPVALHQVVFIFGILGLAAILSVLILIFENLYFVKNRKKY